MIKQWIKTFILIKILGHMLLECIMISESRQTISHCCFPFTEFIIIVGKKTNKIKLPWSLGMLGTTPSYYMFLNPSIHASLVLKYHHTTFDKKRETNWPENVKGVHFKSEALYYRETRGNYEPTHFTDVTRIWKRHRQNGHLCQQ